MLFLVLLNTFFLGLAAAQESIVNPTTAASGAVAIPTGTNGYTYVGCYNETVNVANSGGVRALASGPNQDVGQAYV